MTSVADPGDAPRRKGVLVPVIIGLFLALAGGGGAFYALRNGMVAFGEESPAPMHASSTTVGYVSVDPLIVTLPRATGRQFLRFTASLEVPTAHLAEVEGMRPRIVDVMNVYLRAVEPADFEDQMILSRLRAQLLRRIQVVAGEGRVRDLLVIEFVLN